jgi:hypothetical protein
MIAKVKKFLEEQGLKSVVLDEGLPESYKCSVLHGRLKGATDPETIEKIKDEIKKYCQ